LIVSLSALSGRLSAQGIVVASPHELTRLDERGRAIVDAWVEDAVDSLLSPMISINCLFNPQAILVGGRLPASIVENLATRLNQKLHASSAKMPAIAPVARAALSDDAPAVGAAILPYSERLLPTRSALMKVAVSI